MRDILARRRRKAEEAGQNKQSGSKNAWGRQTSGDSGGVLPTVDRREAKNSCIRKPPPPSVHNGITSLKAAKLCENADSDLFETQPGKPVVLEMTVGSGAEDLVESVSKQLVREFGYAIELKVTKVGKLKGCQQLKVDVGRGVMLWDRATMMSYMDDPFKTSEGAKVWIGAILRESMPNLRGSVKLRRYVANHCRR